MSTTTRLSFSESPGKVSILFIDSDPLDKAVNLADLGMMSMVGAIISILRRELAEPLTMVLYLPFARPGWVAQLEKWLGCDVNYSTNHYRIELRSEDLDRPLNSGVPNLLQAVEPLVQDQQLVIEQKNIVLKVSRLLFELSPFSPPGAVEMAENLNMSSRTFQRKLAEVGLSYRQLVAKIRYEKALALVSSLDKALTSVAYELGFSDSSSFSRAFKGWTGQSPRDCRYSMKSEKQVLPVTRNTCSPFFDACQKLPCFNIFFILVA